jgi:hypothetical protein
MIFRSEARTPAPATFDAIMAADRLIGSENEFMAGMRAALGTIIIL